MRGKKALIFSLILAAILFISLTCSAEEASKGTIIKIYRDSYLFDFESGANLKTKEGMRVTPGDMITTFDKATTIVDFNYDIIKLDPKTSIRLIKFDGGNKGEGNTEIFLLSGMLYVKVEERTDDSSFKLVTSGSVIESKSAEFTVEAIIGDVPTEDAETREFLKTVGKQGEIDWDTRVFNVDVIITVYTGSVTSSVIDTATKSTRSPVNIREGEELANRFRHVVFGFGEMPGK